MIRKRSFKEKLLFYIYDSWYNLVTGARFSSPFENSRKITISVTVITIVPFDFKRSLDRRSFETIRWYVSRTRRTPFEGISLKLIWNYCLLKNYDMNGKRSFKEKLLFYIYIIRNTISLQKRDFHHLSSSTILEKLQSLIIITIVPRF